MEKYWLIGCKPFDKGLLLGNQWKVQMSEKKERFVRLAEARVSRAMESIRIIGNLANTNNYEYDNDDVQAIVKALQAEVAKLKLQFEIKSGNSKQQFKLGK